MAFFKFRTGGDESPAASSQPESVEVLRRRARHRLIGAAVLVLVGVIGFPLLFDTQPRPIAVDIPIEIPDRNKAKPLAQPAQSAPKAEAKATEPPRPTPAAAASRPVAPLAAAPAAQAPVASVKPEPRPPAAEPSSPPPPRVEAAPKPEVKAETAVKPPARQQAPVQGKPVQVASQQAAEARFVVQVGAFSDAVKARETRLKVEKAGLKTYTHVTDTREGKRIRVRVGPFVSRSDADKAAGKIKELDLPASVLTL